MTEIKARDNRCEKCSRFSHCNNNELVCLEKFWEVKCLSQEARSALWRIKDIIDNNVFPNYYEIYNVVEQVLGEQ